MAKHKKYLLAFGANLKKLMTAKGFTPEDIAAHGNIETKQVYRVINGEHSSGLIILYSIAKGLGVKPKVLFDFEFEDKE